MPWIRNLRVLLSFMPLYSRQDQKDHKVCSIHIKGTKLLTPSLKAYNMHLLPGEYKPEL